ncbi:MAG: DMT family transporter [Rhizobiales bacterium]|nr:DMT family transporter [Hyphomicrobiales bacterium]
MAAAGEPGNTAPQAGPEEAGRSWPGVIMIAASAAAFSSAGLFTGLLPTDIWTMLFWRSAFGGLVIGGFLAWSHGAALAGMVRRIGLPGLAVAACSTAGTICFLFALRQSSVAEVTVIYATAPFIAAVATWAWTGERPGRTTLGASLLALIGVMAMVRAAPAAGHLAGNLLALAMTTLIATMMVIIRRHREVSMLPAACLSAFACMLVVAPAADPAGVTGPEFLALALFGILFGLGLLLLTLGSRRIAAARAALIGNLELPLAPFWAWLALGQLPPRAAWLGGAIVLVAVLVDIAAGACSARPVVRARQA